MIKIHYSQKILILLLLLTFGGLSGCTPSDASPATTPPPSTVVTTASPETTVPSTTAPSVLSWEIPDYPEMSYEEYFSTIRVYGYEEREWPEDYYYYRSVWRNGDNRCELWFQQRKLLAGSSLDGKYVQVGSETYDDDDLIVAYNEEWIFLVIDGTDLIRMDYHGENKETLFVDESGKIAQHELATSAYIRDNCVLFFMAGAGDDYGIYRLYLPDMTLDLLVTSEESIWLLGPYSSHELSRFISNPEFTDLCQRILATHCTFRLPTIIKLHGRSITIIIPSPVKRLSRDFTVTALGG